MELRSIARACETADAWLLAQRPVHHVPGMRPLFSALMASILRWPDRTVSRCLVRGFEVVDQIEPSLLYRNIEPKPVPDEPFLGPPAAAFVDALEADGRVHPQAQTILDETVKEQDLGLVGPFLSRAQCDEKWGVGRWRPVPRHVVYQDGKYRPIDDGRAGGHNRHTIMSETIVVVRPDLPLRLSIILFDLAMRLLGLIPAWLQMVLGTEDMWKGYRQFFAVIHHQCVTVVTFRLPSGERVYVPMYGLNFGFESVVLQFNRCPQLIVAVARRCMALLLSAYFDDFKLMSLRCLAARTKLNAIRLCKLFQAQIGHTKSQPMRMVSKFLGVFSDLRWLLRRQLSCFVAPRTLRNALAIIDNALAVRSLSAAEASKLRGMVQWLDMELLGRPCRGAMGALIARQYYESDPLVHERLAMSLKYLRATLTVCASKVYHLLARPGKPTVVYTDASTDAPCDSGLRLGAVIFQDGFVYCISLDVPEFVVQSWRTRLTYIATAELLIAPLLVLSSHSLFSERDVLWFIDNQSALGALIKSASSADDMSEMALLNSLALASVAARVWFEYVPSKLNVSDPLSREGWSSAKPEWIKLHLNVRWDLFLDRLDSALQMIAALGV